jgi:hypothetical protein
VGELVDYAALSEIRLHPHKADRVKLYFGVQGLKPWTVSCPDIGTAFIQPLLDRADAAKSPILLMRRLPDGKWLAVNTWDGEAKDPGLGRRLSVEATKACPAT